MGSPSHRKNAWFIKHCSWNLLGPFSQGSATLNEFSTFHQRPDAASAAAETNIHWPSHFCNPSRYLRSMHISYITKNAPCKSCHMFMSCRFQNQLPERVRLTISLCPLAKSLFEFLVQPQEGASVPRPLHISSVCCFKVPLFVGEFFLLGRPGGLFGVLVGQASCEGNFSDVLNNKPSAHHLLPQGHTTLQAASQFCP